MDNKTEDYLDSLLSNISPEHKRQVQEKKSSDYMADFEKELEHMDMEEFVQDFERELDSEEEAGEGQSEQEFFDNLEDIVEGVQKPEGETKPETEAGSEEEKQDGDIFEVNTMEDDGWTQSEETDSGEASAVESEAEDDGRTGEEKELMELLSEVAQNDDDLSGIGDLLKADENNEPVEDSGGDTQISLSDIAGEGEEEESGKGKKGRKKKKKKEKREGETFFQKISRVLFGEDNEEEIEGGKRSVAGADANAAAPESQELGSISDENLQILQELDSAGAGGDDSSEEDKKGKKKKKKKEKKPKPKKQKKPKEKKPPKPKKPKKPKEVDLSPPLPRGPVVLIFVMGASLMLFILLSANLLNYNNDVKAATASFNQADYVEAYQLLEGMKIKKGDEELYKKTLVLAQVQSEYQAGEILYTAKQYRKSLDSYICALGRYDINYEQAVEAGAEEEFAELEKKIVFQLDECFGVSPETAREIYATRSRKEYTKQIYDIVKALGLLEETEE